MEKTQTVKTPTEKTQMEKTQTVKTQKAKAETEKQPPKTGKRKKFQKNGTKAKLYKLRSVLL